MPATRTQYQNAVNANYFFVVAVSSPSYAVVQEDRWVHADPTVSPITLTLSATPVPGELHYINDATGFAGTNAITINGNGNTINGSSTLTLNSAYQSIILEFNGTTWSAFGAGGAAPSEVLFGDNGDAARMTSARNFIADYQLGTVPTIFIPSPVLVDGTADGGTPAGADLVLNERRLFMVGSVNYPSASTTLNALFIPQPVGPTIGNMTVVSTAGFAAGMVIAINQVAPPLNGTFLIHDIPNTTTLAVFSLTLSGPGNFNSTDPVTFTSGLVDGQLYSMETGGFQFGLDFSSPTLGPQFTSTGVHNPSAIIGMGTPNSFFNLVQVGSRGVISNYTYESIHSTVNDFNLLFDAATENWHGGRACYIYQDSNFNHGSTAEVYWTAPLADKIYQANIFFDGGDPTFQTFTGQAPTAICATGGGTFWVSFTGSGVIRQFQVVPTGPVPHTSVPTFSQVGGDIALTNVLELFFDGKYLWAASTNGAQGTIYKLDQTGHLIDTYTVFAAHALVTSATRMCSDGVSVWVTLDQVVARIFSEGGTGSISQVVTLTLSTNGINHARGITAASDGTVYLAVYDADTPRLNIRGIFLPTGAWPDIRTPKAIVWTLGEFTMPTTFTAINIPSIFATQPAVRLYELDIVATGSGGGNAAWRKSFAVYDNGSMTLQGSVADVIPPRLNATALSEGWDVTIADGSSLTVTFTMGIGVNPSRWTARLVETNTYGGAL